MAPAWSLVVNTLRERCCCHIGIGQQVGLVVLALGRPDQHVGVAENRLDLVARDERALLIDGQAR